MSHPYYPSGVPRFNHVALSLPSALLDRSHREQICRFWGDVFGFEEMEVMTEDRRRLILSCVHWDQFIFLIADDEPMACPRMDHFGFSVGTLAELQGVQDRADSFRARDDRVDLIDLHTDDQGVVKIHSVYVRYLLPMMCEVQWWEFAVVSVTGSGGLEIGVFVPQGWKLEYTGWTAADAWARSVELAELAEALGYHHLWVYDHVETVPRREPTHVFEAFTMLAALSQRTARVGLGQLVTCSSYRNAGLLAKEAACVDVYSRGRLILGLGAGWFHEEYASYGYPYLSNRERLAVLDETVEVVRRLWTEETVTFHGDQLRFDGAYADPKPIQQSPPILIGGGGEQVNLRIAARRADQTNWQVGLDAFRRKSDLLAGYCDEVGRPFEAIRRTHGPDCRIFDSEADCLAWCASEGGGDLWGGTPTDEYLADNLVGTADQVIEKAQAFVDAGCGGLILWLRDYPGDETLRRFMGDVVPHLEVPR